MQVSLFTLLSFRSCWDLVHSEWKCSRTHVKGVHKVLWWLTLNRTWSFFHSKWQHSVWPSSTISFHISYTRHCIRSVHRLMDQHEEKPASNTWRSSPGKETLCRDWKYMVMCNYKLFSPIEFSSLLSCHHNRMLPWPFRSTGLAKTSQCV